MHRASASSISVCVQFLHRLRKSLWLVSLPRLAFASSLKCVSLYSIFKLMSLEILNSFITLFKCLCVWERERQKNMLCFVRADKDVWGQCVCFWKVWPVLRLLLSVQTICSFSLKPTRSMRVICQVKYCSFLLFHLTLLHWGYDNISATSCQHPLGSPALLWRIISQWEPVKMIQRMEGDHNWNCTW